MEVVIFRYTQDVGVGSERFLPDEPAPEPELALEELPEDDEPAIIEEPAPLEDEEAELPPDIELVLLEEDEYQMAEIFDRLEELDVYEPVMHFGWTQATWPKEQTEALPLHRFAEVPEGLDGTLTLYLSRFLHLVVDLQLKAPQEEEDAGYVPTPGYGDFALLRDYDAQASQPVHFRIQEDRILRNGELRYYDHPKFGLLAKVTRVEEEEDPETGELLGYPLQ